MASTTAAVLVGALFAPVVLFAATPLGIQVEAAYTTDDNVSRAADAYKLSDRSYSVKLSKNMDFPISSSTRLRVLGFLGDEQFNTYTGLSHYFFGIRGELQYRDDSEFDSPTFGVFARTSKDEYESYLRDSYRYSAGITVSKPLTESMQVYAALTRNVRDSNSAVFDTQEWSGRLNMDYALSRNSTLYVAGEYHRGDTVSSAPLSLAYLDIAEAVVRDDAFPGRIAYRVNARTAIATIGFNLALSDKQSLDISGRWVQATPTATPGYPVPGNALRYVDKQFAAAYLIRF